MHRVAFCIVFTFSLVTVVPADDASPQQQLADIREKIEEEKSINAELQADLAARETKVSELKLQLKDLEDRIAALRQEHNMP